MRPRLPRLRLSTIFALCLIIGVLLLTAIVNTAGAAL